MIRTQEDIDFANSLEYDLEKGTMSKKVEVYVKPALGFSNRALKSVGVSCDQYKFPALSTGDERIVDETIYNIAAKKPELVGQIAVEKIDYYHRIWPEYQYDSVTYHKDNTGGMRCQFKFKLRK